MNWALFWEVIKQIIFWFFLILGVAGGWTNTFNGGVPTWHTRWLWGFIYLVCLMVMAFALKVFN